MARRKHLHAREHIRPRVRHFSCMHKHEGLQWVGWLYEWRQGSCAGASSGVHEGMHRAELSHDEQNSCGVCQPCRSSPRASRPRRAIGYCCASTTCSAAAAGAAARSPSPAAAQAAHLSWCGGLPTTQFELAALTAQVSPRHEANSQCLESSFAVQAASEVAASRAIVPL